MLADLLGRARRISLHRRIAETLRDHFPLPAQTEPEIVAHHFGQAKRTVQAVRWWAAAARLADRRGAYVEATAHYSRAVATADELPEDHDNIRLRLDPYVDYRNLLIAVQGWASQTTIAAHTQCAELGAQIGDQLEMTAATRGAWLSAYVRGQASESLGLAQVYFDKLNKYALDADLLANALLGQSQWCCGKFEKAVATILSSAAAYDPIKHARHEKRFRQDYRAIQHACLSRALWPLGHLEAARTACERGVEQAALRDPATVTHNLGWKCQFEAIRGDLKKLRETAGSLNENAQKHGMKFWITASEMWLNLAHREMTGLGAAIEKARRAIGIIENLQTFLTAPVQESLRADLEGERDPEAGLTILDNILSINASSGHCFHDAELNRQRGCFLYTLNKKATSVAEAAFRSCGQRRYCDLDTPIPLAEKL